ncbi:MAG: hypothetical protein V2I32_05740, partial [Desulforhopalus sp.]|nr:hypothetical protein [Desulforhopalus sp.]
GRQTGHPWPGRRLRTSCPQPCGPCSPACRASSDAPSTKADQAAELLARKKLATYIVDYNAWL